MAEKKQEKAKEKKETKIAGQSSVNSLLVVVRISGMVKIKKDVAETLDRLKLRRKYACVLIDSSDKSLIGMLEKVKQFVAYGSVNEKVLRELVSIRGIAVGDGKVDVDKVVNGLLEGKKLDDLGLKGFFRLHPPRKGIKSKLHYPKGVLGNHGDKINDLIVRML